MDGMFVENPSEASISAGGGGRIPGPVSPGMTLRESQKISGYSDDMRQETRVNRYLEVQVWPR